MTNRKIQINRAPVLTLWAVVVAERLGYEAETALTLGKAVAALNAQSKGRRLGIYEARDADEKAARREGEARGEVAFVGILGRDVPVVSTAQGLRAAIDGEEIRPESVDKYLQQKFGAALEDARAAMAALAGAYGPEDLDRRAYGLYEKFRPRVPAGTKGWGAKGELDLDFIRSLAG